MASKAETEKKVIAMRKLGYNDTEIAEMLQADAEIDRGEKLFELPDELKAGAKKARQAERKTGTPVKREKKVDNDKRYIMYTIMSALGEVENLETINPEREITFTYNERKYRVTLALPRT